MKTFVKISVSLASVALCFCLASCSFLSALFSFHSNLSGGTQQSHAGKISFSENDLNRARLQMSELDDLIEGGGKERTFTAAMTAMDKYYYDVTEAFQTAYINYCMYGRQSDLEEYGEYYSVYIDFAQWYNKAYHALMSSPFRQVFYGDMSDEEILELIGEEKSDEYYALTLQINELQTQFGDLSYEEAQANAPELMAQFVRVANSLAVEEGYDNYLEYCYENVYLRDYSPEDTDGFFGNVRTYVGEALTKNYQSFNPQADLEYSDYIVFNNFYAYNGYTEFMDVFDDYASDMGGRYYDAYRYLWSGRGYYYISAEDDGFQGAFTDYFIKADEPYVYFGPHYRSILTLVHEFGHYFVFTQSSGNACMDLSETQSQGDEMMFMRYMFDNYRMSDDLIGVIETEKMTEVYREIIMCGLVNEFEKYVYTKENITAADIVRFESAFERVFREKLSKSMDFDFSSYWRMVCIQSPGYYISYATSLMNCLELYALASDDYAAAKNAYMKLCVYDYENLGYLDVLDYAGLSNPLGDKIFEKLFVAGKGML